MLASLAFEGVLPATQAMLKRIYLIMANISWNQSEYRQFTCIGVDNLAIFYQINPGAISGSPRDLEQGTAGWKYALTQGGKIMELDIENGILNGDEGSLHVPKDDEITHKLAMLIEGECEGLGPKQAADKFGYSQQRYFQIREAFLQQGAVALANKKRGPKSNYRRTDEVERQVIRCRFLDPDANSEVIAQKLRQQGITISDRTVRRIFEKYGLQKKTL